MRHLDPVPTFALLLAAAWLGGQALGSVPLMAGAAALAMPAAAAVALRRRHGARRVYLAAGLAGLAILLGLGLLLCRSLPAVLAGAAALLIPVPLLFAWTFPGGADR